jgi:hypothetical protein
MSVRRDFKLQDRGPLLIWEHPEVGMKYSLGADAATGVGKDWTVFSVLRNTIPLVQVARYRAKINTVDASCHMVDLGWYYNRALIVCETNYPGNALVDGAVVTHKYPNMYQSEDRLDADPGVSSKFGITTTQASKWLFIRETQEMLQKGQLVLNDKDTLEEFCNFVYLEDKSKTGAAEGMNDDCVMATMLAVHGAILYPVRIQKVERGQRIEGENANVAQQRKMLHQYFENAYKTKKKRFIRYPVRL